jgi:DNA-binding transcriptional LysR family regulator
MQQLPDLSLLPALDALLTEASVTRAAARLALSPPAMSRTLGRLRRQLDDELLVPAGRGLRPTPLAEAMRPQVRAALEAASAVLRPPVPPDVSDITTTLSLRSAEWVAAALMPDLFVRARREIPGLTLRLLPEGDEDPADLRHSVDLDVGVMGELPFDIRTRQLVQDRLVMLVRPGHPLTRGRVTPARLARTEQIMISRQGLTRGAVDERLAELGLSRRVPMVTTSHAAAAFAAAGSDAAAMVASKVAPVFAAQLGLVIRPIPLDLPGIPIAMAWHTRLDRDVAAQWLRDTVAELLVGQSS